MKPAALATDVSTDTNYLARLELSKREAKNRCLQRIFQIIDGVFSVKSMRTRYQWILSYFRWVCELPVQTVN